MIYSTCGAPVWLAEDAYKITKKAFDIVKHEIESGEEIRTPHDAGWIVGFAQGCAGGQPQGWAVDVPFLAWVVKTYMNDGFYDDGTFPTFEVALESWKRS